MGNKRMKRVFVAFALLLSGCTAVGDSMNLPSADVTGKWAGTWSLHSPTMRYPEIGYGNILMTLKQNAADVSGELIATGELMVPGSPTAMPRYFEGAISGSSITLKSPYSSGFLEVRGDQMTGVIGAIMPVNVNLRRQRRRPVLIGPRRSEGREPREDAAADALEGPPSVCAVSHL